MDELTVSISLSRKARVRGIGPRLAAHSTPNEQGCLCWLGAIAPNGYGRMTVNGSSRLAHRIAWEHFVGHIPDGMTIDHLCRNRACINVAHMEVVTRGENVLRGNSLLAQQSRQTHCVHGHEFTKANTYIYKNHRGCRECRKLYQRHLRAVRLFVDGRYVSCPTS